MKTTLFQCYPTAVCRSNLSAQNSKYSDSRYSERYGNTLNLGLESEGIQITIHRSYCAVLSISTNLAVANNFTLAPFATFYTYHYNYYRETVIPIGGKATYYFDQILGAGQDWDFYLAGSLGFAIVNTRWDSGYYQDNNYHAVNPLFLDLHIGAEYHLSQKVGLFLIFLQVYRPLALRFTK